MKLAGARVLLTGATGGLGAATARRLARDGAAVLLAGRDAGALEALARELGERGTRACWLAGDMTSRTDRERLVSRASQWHGGINVLVNNAGVNDFALLEDQDEARIEALVQVNLVTPMMLCRALLPSLRRFEEAHVVNVGSTFGSIGYPGYAPYCASKFALRGFTEAMRRETADSAVRFHYLAPRATRTSMNSEAVNAMNAALGVGSDEPDLVADAVAALIEHGGRETYLGWPERLFVRINAVLPGLVDGSLGRQLPTIKHYAGRPADEGAAEGGSPA